MRLDKLLTEQGFGSRSEVKEFIRRSQVVVNGKWVKDPGFQVYPEKDEIICKGQTIAYQSTVHVMLNKPQGVLTAARDAKQKTVMDLLPQYYRSKGCMAAGRLDKNTEGLLIITNDGQLAHRLISPKHEVGKTYYAVVDGPLSEEDITAFKEGLAISDSDGEFQALPAELTILQSAPEESIATVRVQEGKYHQVKRMFASRGVTVTFLKRLAIGSLKLDETLEPGQFRELTEEEVQLLEK